jgi:hypothetical protein
VSLFDPARPDDPEQASRLWTESVVRSRLAVDANRVCNELERAATHARGLLDDPRMSAPELAGARARVLGACIAVGKVALDVERQ